KLLERALAREHLDARITAVVAQKRKNNQNKVKADHQAKHQPPWKRTNTGMAGKKIARARRSTLLRQRWQPGETQKDKYSHIVVAQTALDHTPKRSFEMWVAKIAHDQLLPRVAGRNTIILQDRRQVFGFEQPQPAAPQIVVACAAGLDH